MMLTLSESQSQSLTNKTTTMDTSSSKERMGATTTNSGSGGEANSGISGNNSGACATSKSNESGSQNTYQPAELQPKLKSILPVVAQCTYTPCYCEENIWKLCDSIRNEFPSEIQYCHVSFISNQKRMVPMWRQKAGKNEEKLALWDYHVILLYNPNETTCVVYDMDSDLPFPTHFHRYVSETFRTENILQPEYHRCFRILPASKFLTLFSSDRRHMKRSDGSWIKPPPSYPPIYIDGSANNLEHFMEVTIPKTDYGELFSLMELVRRFYKPRQLS